MKMIILAAGEGKRLRPHTADKPKCLIEIAGKSLLDWQIDQARSAGIEEIVVIKGYREEQIIRRNVRYYVNQNYATTNMVETLWCAAQEFEDDFILSYADILYESGVLAALLNSRYDISVVVDKGWQSYWQKRFDDPLSDAESLRVNAEGLITDIGQKAEALIDIEAQYIGLMRFAGKGIDRLRFTYNKAREQGRRGESPFGSGRKFEQLYMTDLLQGMINLGVQLNAVNIQRGWLEIDSLEDYELAQNSVLREGKAFKIVH